MNTLQNWWNNTAADTRKAAIEQAVPDQVRKIGESAAWSRMSWEELNSHDNPQRMPGSCRRQLAEYLGVRNA